MGKRVLRLMSGVLATSALVVGLAACGSSSPTIASQDFISACTGKQAVQQAIQKAGGGSKQVLALCKCLQQTMVSKGFGNRTADDKSADVQAAGEQADLKCVQQVLG